MDRKPVELVRVPREEQYFEREEVLGRDAASVFPTEAKKAAVDNAGLAELLGAGKAKFISETELEEIKSKRGLSVGDGTLAADKPLAEILREAKEAKEAAFQEQWKTMKQGKNRPLDDDEFEFVDSIAQAEAAARRRQREEEEAELAAFHAAQRGAAGGGGEGAGAGAGAIVGLAEEQQPGAGSDPAAPAAAAAAKPPPAAKPAAARKPPPLVAIKPIVRTVVKAKGAGGAAASSGNGGGPSAKRQRTEGEQPGRQQQQQQDERGGSGSEGEGPGLAGLLGGYGSGSDSDS
ncbi:hypothetical protein ABPG77_009977 [Micractinium sp. CCAP 211/92]